MIREYIRNIIAENITSVKHEAMLKNIRKYFRNVFVEQGMTFGYYNKDDNKRDEFKLKLRGDTHISYNGVIKLEFILEPLMIGASDDSLLMSRLPPGYTENTARYFTNEGHKEFENVYESFVKDFRKWCNARGWHVVNTGQARLEPSHLIMKFTMLLQPLPHKKNPNYFAGIEGIQDKFIIHYTAEANEASIKSKGLKPTGGKARYGHDFGKGRLYLMLIDKKDYNDSQKLQEFAYFISQMSGLSASGKKANQHKCFVVFDPAKIDADNFGMNFYIDSEFSKNAKMEVYDWRSAPLGWYVYYVYTPTHIPAKYYKETIYVDVSGKIKAESSPPKLQFNLKR
jgi:hypothetical protein